jgi:hypothetical protein
MSDESDRKETPRQTKGSSTQKDRAEEKRREKLEQIQEQVDSGQLKIRQMTPDERKRNPPRPRQPKRGRW